MVPLSQTTQEVSVYENSPLVQKEDAVEDLSLKIQVDQSPEIVKVSPKVEPKEVEAVVETSIEPAEEVKKLISEDPIVTAVNYVKSPDLSKKEEPTPAQEVESDRDQIDTALAEQRRLKLEWYNNLSKQP